MNHYVRTIGSAFAFSCLLQGVSAPAQAAGTGVPPFMKGEYTPGKVGRAQSPPVTGATETSGAQQGCDWAPIYGDTSSQNLAFPEANATYWQASPPQSIAAGAQIRIDGHFPNARFFSIGLYNSSWQLLGTLNDYEMVADSGARPFLAATKPNTSVARGQAYTAFIAFADAPAAAARNTLYAPPQRAGLLGGTQPQKLYLLYRVYVAGAQTASGDVPLPALSINGQAFSASAQSSACRNTIPQALQNLLFAIPIRPGQAAFGTPKAPAFTVYKDSGVPGLDVGVSGSNQYMSAKPSLPAGYVYMIRGKAPSYTASPKLAGGAVANTRYWSLCQNTSISTEVVACVGDFQAVLDRGGYYHVVVSNDAAAPEYADVGHGYNWMPFGPQSPAAVIYRQMLADPAFPGAIGNASIGAYMPQIAYCTVSAFQSLARAYPASPDLVFQACGGADL